MCADLKIQLNGQPRTFSDLATPTSMASLIHSLDLKSDRIAVELNGSIVSRADWPSTEVKTEDKLEVVHFVGGGIPPAIKPGI